MSDPSKEYIYATIVELLREIRSELRLLAARLEPPEALPPRGVSRGEHATTSQQGRRASPETKQPDPRHAPMVERLFQEFQLTRGHKYLFSPRDAKALSKLLKLCRDDNEISARWKRGLQTAFPACHSIIDLERNWNAYAPPPGEIINGPEVRVYPEEIRKQRAERDAKLKAIWEKSKTDAG